MAAGVKTSRVLYLYGISQTANQPRAVIGVDGEAKVEGMRCGGLVCWISRVAKTDFADNLAKNIENLDWLTERTPRHQAALAAIAEENDVLPARFGTVF